ncbi:hypothetical protein SMJ63A_20343 [Stenotrophomonas geniculata]
MVRAACGRDCFDSNSNSNSNSNSGSWLGVSTCWVGPGWGGGTRRKPIHGGSMAPCSCALSCAHGKTGVGRPAQPARGMPRAHGANGPARPSRLTLANFAVTDGNSIVVIGVEKCRVEPCSTPSEATRCCSAFLLIFRG